MNDKNKYVAEIEIYIAYGKKAEALELYYKGLEKKIFNSEVDSEILARINDLDDSEESSTSFNYHYAIVLIIVAVAILFIITHSIDYRDQKWVDFASSSTVNKELVLAYHECQSSRKNQKGVGLCTLHAADAVKRIHGYDVEQKTLKKLYELAKE